MARISWFDERLKDVTDAPSFKTCKVISIGKTYAMKAKQYQPSCSAADGLYLFVKLTCDNIHCTQDKAREIVFNLANTKKASHNVTMPLHWLCSVGFEIITYCIIYILTFMKLDSIVEKSQRTKYFLKKCWKISALNIVVLCWTRDWSRKQYKWSCNWKSQFSTCAEQRTNNRYEM